MFEVARFLHIIAGFTALFIFWVPIVTKKGGKAHVRTGWVYTAAMAIVAISAFTMGAWRLLVDPTADLEQKAFSLFLIFIAILSSASAWYGLRVLRYKKRQGRHQDLADLAFSLLLMVGGIGVSIYGYSIDFTLLTWFPFIGIILGFSQLVYWLRPPQNNMHWLFEHLSGMMGCCIATITAFVVFGAPRLLSLPSVSPLLWFLPTILLVPVIAGFTAYYRKKYSKAA